MPVKPKIIERKLGREKAVGLAHFEEKLIEIDPRQKPFDYLETAIHEYIHLWFPKMEEDEVLKKGHELAMFLWKLKFRRVHT